MKPLTAIPLAGLLLLSALPAGAGTLSCVTINGATQCSRGDQSLTCTTDDDLTSCRSRPDVFEHEDDLFDDEDSSAIGAPAPRSAKQVEVRRTDSGLRVRSGDVTVEIE